MGSNKTQRARQLDVSTRHLNRLISDGVLPPMADGGYDVDVVRVVYLRHLRSIASGRGGDGAADLTKARTELAKQQSERLALKIAIMKMEFWRTEEAERAVTDVFSLVDDKLWSMTALASRDLAGLTLPYEEVKAVIDRRMGEAMEALQPSEAVIKAAEESRKWVKEHGGRL
jgi:phage terminase Nu1 subunit (DNA packaging protein)